MVRTFSPHNLRDILFLTGLPTCSWQTRLDHTLQQKQRIAAKMKQEKHEMQEFSSLMKSVLHDNKDKIRDHQDNIAQVCHTIRHMLMANFSSKLQHLTLQGSKG